MSKKLLKTILTHSNVGCDCGRPKLKNVYDPIPITKPKPSTDDHPPDPSTSSYSSFFDKSGANTEDDDYTTISFNRETSSECDTDPKPNRSNVIHSLAVVKDSNDPYEDFRHSMLQMITERQIYSKDDLQQLLQCFLELNSPHHHGVIIRAFTEIWSEMIVSKKLMLTGAHKRCP
ncbi:hypothetical protein K2173_020762 [Erythroxylum novogranatense]|uniref:Transcription repressor n=1 Tax=Erythroxylum novogranatense TaxID=1862640 RepID=A0AAV8TLV5_9ROSI|nr:hypothetical protein K2173_020762 [Erythroxylum novogranatense]